MHTKQKVFREDQYQFSTISSLETTQTCGNCKEELPQAEGRQQRWMVAEAPGELGAAHAPEKEEVSEGLGKAAQGSPPHACPRRHWGRAGPAPWAAAVAPPSFPWSDGQALLARSARPQESGCNAQGESGRAHSLLSSPAGTRGVARPGLPARREAGGSCPRPLAVGKLLASLLLEP